MDVQNNGRDAQSAQSDAEAKNRADTAAAGNVAAAGRAAGTRRSEATRAAILHAARDRFATDGYERATIRAIARDAGIDPSMVMRYYGNKEGLFAAASEFDLRLPEAGGMPREEAGARLVRHFLDRWEGDETLNALLRVSVTNAAGAERVQAVFRDQVAPVVAALCPDQAQVPTRAALLASQILGMALTRYVLRLPPAVELTHDEIVEWLAPSVQRYLTAERP
jgi:AcrR family transcriptional regulator